MNCWAFECATPSSGGGASATSPLLHHLLERYPEAAESNPDRPDAPRERQRIVSHRLPVLRLQRERSLKDNWNLGRVGALSVDGD
jgi:hypothetical protein